MRPDELDRLRAILATRPPQRLEDPGAKQAAVACVLRTLGDRVEVLLIQRAERPGDHWSGQMAFPGGRAEPVDVDLRATATRETREEVGLDLEAHGELLGPLDEQWPRMRTGLVVSPWVWHLHTPEVPLAPNAEVADTVWTPVEPMLRGHAATEYPLRWNGMDVKMPAFRLHTDDTRVVWGMTHRMLVSLFDLLRQS